MQDIEFFKNVFGTALTATFIPYLIHSTLCKLTNLDSGPQQDNLVPIGNGPKQPNCSSSSTVFNHPPSLKFPSHSKQQNIPRSTGGYKDSGKIKASTEGEERESREYEPYESYEPYEPYESYVESFYENENENEGYDEQEILDESEIAELVEQANETAIKWLEQEGFNIQEAMQLAQVSNIQEFSKLESRDIHRIIERVIGGKSQQEQENQKDQAKQLKEKLEKAFGDKKELSEIDKEMVSLALEGFFKSSGLATDKAFQVTINTASQFLDALFKSNESVSFEHFYTASGGNFNQALKSYENYLKNNMIIEKIESKYKITKEQLVDLCKEPLHELYLSENSKSLKEISKFLEKQVLEEKSREKQKIKEEKLEKMHKEFQEKIKILKENISLDQDQHTIKIENLIKQFELINPLLNENHLDIESKLTNVWNKHESHYNELTEKINKLLISVSDEFSEFQVAKKAFYQINKLINQRTNLITLMEREIPSLVEKAKNQILERNAKNAREQQIKLSREAYEVDKAARERENEKIQEKLLQIKTVIEKEHDAHAYQLHEIAEQYLRFISSVEFYDCTNIETFLQEYWDQYQHTYSILNTEIEKLDHETLVIDLTSDSNSLDKVFNQINNLLEQQSSIVHKMQKDVSINIEKYKKLIEIEDRKKVASDEGRLCRELGLKSEPFVNHEIFAKRFGFEIVNVNKLSSGRGFDGVFRDSQGNLIINECKTNCKYNPSKTFQRGLEKSYGHKQGSQGWVIAVAQEMVKQGSEFDKQIAEEILKDPNKVKVVGSYVDTIPQRIQVLKLINNKKWLVTHAFSIKVE